MSCKPNVQETGVEAPQCQFFVQRKKRLCRMTVKPGRRFCGEHEPQPKNGAGESDNRIPCPNDPKHTCYISKLEKHLQICNARRTEQPAYIVDNINAPEDVEAVPRRPLNTIPKDDLMRLIDKVNHLYAKHLEGHIKEEPQQQIHEAVMPDFSAPDRAESSLRHLRQVSALLWVVEREGLVRDGTCYVELGAGKGQLSYYAWHAWCARAGRVLAVDRAPLRHKRDNKLRARRPRGELDSNHSGRSDNVAHIDEASLPAVHEGIDSKEGPGDCIADLDTKSMQTQYTEMNSNFNDRDDDIAKTDSSLKHCSDNANKNTSSEPTHGETDSVNNQIIGKSADSADGTTSNDSNIAVTYSNTASEDKQDSGATDKPNTTSDDMHVVEGEVASRLRADLAHLVLDAVPAVQASTGVVGIAKHLCGVATDYALRCVAAARGARGAALATCCHHRCARAAHAGRRQLQELGINAEEFNMLLGLVSWATCGDGRSRGARGGSGEREGSGERGGSGEREGSGKRGGRGEREATGRKAKALLDYGRVLWLRARGFDARLCYFVPSSVSLENVCLIARKRFTDTS